MTREEAINNLKDFIDTYITVHGEEDIITVSLDNFDVEAFHVAIKALEQEPCEDAVSRASVFEILGNLMSIPYDLDRPINKDDVSESMDAIRVLPSVTPAPKKCHNENHDYAESEG